MLGANMPTTIYWKTMDGSFVQMTPTLAGQIFGSVAAWDTATFTTAETHKAAMQASSDPIHYDFSANWPLIFGE
jgi:xanthine/uracil permease